MVDIFKGNQMETTQREHVQDSTLIAAFEKKAFFWLGGSGGSSSGVLESLTWSTVKIALHQNENMHFI